MTIDTIRQVAAQGPFQPEWESLKGYRVPQWYEDAKFGIFIHWGAYAVPAFGSEWYPRNMYVQGSPEFRHHVQTYGPQTEFGYRDFIPLFRGERFDPEAWAQLFVEAGAKFVMPVAEHHDGFAMYDTERSDWSAVKMGPKRDVIKDLAEAFRKRDLVFTASSHRAEHWWFFGGGMEFPSDVSEAQNPQWSDLYGPARTEQEQPSAEFLEDWLARTCEIVDKYRPKVVWFDWWIEQPAFKPYLQLFAAYYYNRAAEWGEGVAINYKNDAYEVGTAVYDLERGQLAGIRPLLWQNDTAVGKNSWGYIQGMDYKKPEEIIRDLVDIVSKNGALLLNVGPRADGVIPDEDQRVLREIGSWLNQNGEAIYGTRPWHVFGEGPTEIEAGMFTDTRRAEFTGQDIRFTTNGDRLFAIVLAWPGESLHIKSLALNAPEAGRVTEVRMLGRNDLPAFEQTPDGLHLSLPPQITDEAAFAFEITRA